MPTSNSNNKYLRHRRLISDKKSKNVKKCDEIESDNQIENEIESTTMSDNNKTNNNSSILPPGSFWLTRIVLIRYLGFIYCK